MEETKPELYYAPNSRSLVLVDPIGNEIYLDKKHPRSREKLVPFENVQYLLLDTQLITRAREALNFGMDENKPGIYYEANSRSLVIIDSLGNKVYLAREHPQGKQKLVPFERVKHLLFDTQFLARSRTAAEQLGMKRLLSRGLEEITIH
jgi:hypothetical protein